MKQVAFLYKVLKEHVLSLALLTLLAGCPLLSFAQTLTGTWIGTYYRDNMGDKRLFYYKLLLIQTGDSVYGVCQALDGEADIKNIPPGQAEVQATYTVSNFELGGKYNNTFTLFAGAVQKTKVSGYSSTSLPPYFQTIKCRAVNENASYLNNKPVIIYSAIPANDEPEGKMEVIRISSETPDIPSVDEDGATGKKKHPERVQDNEALAKKRPRAMGSTPAVIHQNATPSLSYAERMNEVQSVIEINPGIVKIDLYDNGTVDNDTISLYLDEKLLLSKKRLTEKPLHTEITVNNKKDNKLTLFAHNLGDIPPNTAVMVVTAGTSVYRVDLAGSLEKNAVMIIKAKDPKQRF